MICTAEGRMTAMLAEPSYSKDEKYKYLQKCAEFNILHTDRSVYWRR